MRKNLIASVATLLTVSVAMASACAASMFTVSGSGNTFTIIRSGDTSAAETVTRMVGLGIMLGERTDRYRSDEKRRQYEAVLFN